MTLLQLFQKCLSCKYNHVENSGDYYVKRQGSTLYYNSVDAHRPENIITELEQYGK